MGLAGHVGIHLRLPHVVGRAFFIQGAGNVGALIAPEKPLFTAGMPAADWLIAAVPAAVAAVPALMPVGYSDWSGRLGW